MTNADRERFAKLLGGAAVMYRIDLTLELLETYWESLLDLPIERVAEGIAAAIKTAKFFPVVAVIREAIGGNAEQLAEVAFAQATDAIVRHGAYRSVDFGDKAINATINQLGGWVAFCRQDEEHLHSWGRKDFIAMYQSLARSDFSDEIGGHLVGEHEQSNLTCAFPIAPPVMIAHHRGKHSLALPVRKAEPKQIGSNGDGA